jgi:signal transduction histidine kinase
LLAQEYGERLDDKGRNYVERMRRSVLTMDQLIDDLLAYARVERREFELRPINLPNLIDSVLAEQRDELEKSGTLLNKNMQPVDVEADLDGLRMVIRNLLQNAMKFSRQAKPPTIRIDAQISHNEVHLAIADNGIGFDMAYHDRIFEMFQRLHRADEIPGTGIGLAIVRKAMERMGGRVWATASPGAGATFHLQLPAAKRASA